MKTEGREIKLSNGQVRHVLYIFDDEDSEGKEKRRAWFLQTIANNPTLTRPGGNSFDTMTIRHDGAKWVAECVAVVSGARLNND